MVTLRLPQALRIHAGDRQDVTVESSTVADAILGSVAAHPGPPPALPPIDLPSFHRSIMDGYAVIAGDTYGADPGERCRRFGPSLRSWPIRWFGSVCGRRDSQPATTRQSMGVEPCDRVAASGRMEGR